MKLRQWILKQIEDPEMKCILLGETHNSNAGMLGLKETIEILQKERPGKKIRVFQRG